MTRIDHHQAAGCAEPEQFVERVMGLIDSASAAMLLCLGHHTSMFDTLAELPPATCAQIADAAGLNECYVRGWLGGLLVVQLVDYEPDGQTYSLARDRATALVTTSRPDVPATNSVGRQEENNKKE